MHIYKVLLCSLFVSTFTYTMEHKSINNTIISPQSTLDDVLKKWNLSEDTHSNLSCDSFYLFKACDENNHELVKDLLCIDQDSDPLDDLDHTPLQYSMTPKKMSPEIAALLIKHGANYLYKREYLADEKSIIDSWDIDYTKQVSILVHYGSQYNYIKQRELGY